TDHRRVEPGKFRLGASGPVANHVSLIARESEKFESTTQLIMMPDHSLGLQRLASIGQLKFDGHPLSGLNLGRQDGCDATFADIERTTGNAVGQSGAQYGDVDRNGNRITRNTAASS